MGKVPYICNTNAGKQTVEYWGAKWPADIDKGQVACSVKDSI